MINLDFNDPPVRPAVEGTFELPGAGRGMYFTIGRDYVEDKLKELLRKRTTLASDIESFGLNLLRFRLKVVTFADDHDAVILDPRDPFQFDLIKWTYSELQCIIFHNGQFDLPCLYQRGLVTKADMKKVVDTIITSRQANPGELQRHTLENLSKKHLGFTSEAKMSGDDYFKNDIHLLTYIYGSALDALNTYRLLPILVKEVKKRLEIPAINKELELSKEEKDYILWREQRVSQVFLKTSSRGLCVDVDEIDRYEIKTKPVQNRLEIILKQHGLTLQKRTGSFTNSNELVRVLTQLDAFPSSYPRTKTGKLSTTEENLALLRHPLAQAFSQNKKILKVKQYMDNIADIAYKTGRIFPTTNLLAAGTGRISMSGEGPLQQFTPDARGIIVSEEGRQLSSIDWSQVEPTLLIYISGDTSAIDIYENTGTDIYSIVSDITGTDRPKAKTTLLAQMYSQGISALALRLDVSESTAQEYKNRIFAGLPESEKLIKNLKDAGRSGHIATLMGRVLDIPMWDGRFKQSVTPNYYIQGSAYDLLGEVIVKVDEAELSDALLFSVHDELVVDSEAAEDVAAIMRTPPERFSLLAGRTPVLRADPALLGQRWGKV